MLKLYGCFSDLYIKMKNMAPEMSFFFEEPRVWYGKEK